MLVYGIEIQGSVCVCVCVWYSLVVMGCFLHSLVCMHVCLCVCMCVYVCVGTFGDMYIHCCVCVWGVHVHMYIPHNIWSTYYIHYICISVGDWEGWGRVIGRGEQERLSITISHLWRT